MKLNLEFYKKDEETLTSIEEEIVEIIKHHEKEEYEKIIEQNQRVEILEALSNIRNNIISWYPFEKEAKVLEINANFGEIIEELCKRVNKVVATEPSKKKAETIAKRYDDTKNLEIVVGEIEDIQLNEKFDYIILVGALDKDNEKYKEILEKLKSLLTENGIILFAFDNKLRLKIFNQN